MNICQSCKSEFRITPNEQEVLIKLSLPAPTFCPVCSLIRRVSYRNERILYKRKCDAPGHEEDVISIFSPDKPDRIYCQTAWWGDSWDGLMYARDYDFTRPFFSQIRDLWKDVPDMALSNFNSVNSEYCSITEGNKNCYLVIGGDFNENCLYSAFVFNSKDVMDCYWLKKCERCYEVCESISCTNISYSMFCEGCFDSAFLFNCKNCHHCFGCANLKNASYQIWNKQYTKDEYDKKIKEIQIENFDNKVFQKMQYDEFIKNFPRKYARILNSFGCTGDNINHAKNVTNSFDVFDGAEDCANLWLTYSQAKNCANSDHIGKNSELSYESTTVYPGSRVVSCRMILDCHDIAYSHNCHNCSYLFGCIGLRGKQYCIFNKQYTKEEYENMLTKIINHMNEMPYIDKRGIVYKYGEFFPTELSPFAYNETVASELAPLSKEEILGHGYTYQSPQNKTYSATLDSGLIPKTISEVSDNITQEVITCDHAGACAHTCSTAFRITPEELEFYRRTNTPIPHLCWNCRHYERITYRNPLTLSRKVCDCNGNSSKNDVYKNTTSHPHGVVACNTEFETSFPKDSDTIVYCESCYQQEVA
ncbi:MAG: hypothetical protein WCK91_03045 [bacterium]